MYHDPFPANYWSQRQVSMHEIVDCTLVYDWIAEWTFDEKKEEEEEDEGR